MQDLVQDLASLARKILARFAYLLQDRFYWIYLHALSHRQLYVTFPAGLNMGWMTYFTLLVLTRVSSFAMVIFLYLHGQLYLSFSSRVEVGLDDP